MGRMGCLLMLLLLIAVPLAYAAEVHPGDQVHLIEREQHIPAHPAPGDTRVSLRLVSGSQAIVLAIHAATGWLEVRGEPVQGTLNTGWITTSYLASQSGGGEPTSDTLAWCPPKAPPRPIRAVDYDWRPGTWRTFTPRMGNRPISGPIHQ